MLTPIHHQGLHRPRVSRQYEEGEEKIGEASEAVKTSEALFSIELMDEPRTPKQPPIGEIVYGEPDEEGKD